MRARTNGTPSTMDTTMAKNAMGTRTSGPFMGRVSRVVFGASLAQLSAKIGQIMVTDAEIADKTPFADIALTGGVLAEESLKLFK